MHWLRRNIAADSLGNYTAAYRRRGLVVASHQIGSAEEMPIQLLVRVEANRPFHVGDRLGRLSRIDMH